MDLLFNQKLWSGATLAVAPGTLVSEVFDCRLCDIDGLFLKLVAAGAADAKIELTTSPDNVTFTPYVEITASTLADYAGSPEELHKYLVPRNPYGRIKLTNLTAVITTVTGHLSCQEVV